eukprot:1626449-Amphidinium_carterae.2
MVGNVLHIDIHVWCDSFDFDLSKHSIHVPQQFLDGWEHRREEDNAYQYRSGHNKSFEKK